MNELNKLRYQRIKMKARIYLGLQKMRYPHNIAVIVLITIIFILVWDTRKDVFIAMKIPDILQPIYHFSISFAILLIFISLAIGYLQCIANISAKHIETCIALAFEPHDLRRGYPILISCKKDKKRNLIIREFHSFIPKHRWDELSETIADELSEHFATPYITYGGRKRNKGNRIIIYTQPDRVPQKRGILYDRDL